MKVSFRTDENGYFLNIERNDGKWAKVPLTRQQVNMLHSQIISAIPGLAIPGSVKAAVEQLNQLIIKPTKR